MTFPKRWLDDEAARTPMKDLLRAGQDMDPPAGAENAVWIALAAKIGTASVATAAATATAKSAASATATTTTATTSAATTATATTATATATTSAAISGGLLKAILIGAFSGVVAITGYTALEPSSAPPPPASTSATQGAPPIQGEAKPLRGAAAPSSDPAPVLPSSQPTAAPLSSEMPSPPSGASAPAPSPSSDATSAAVSPPPQGDTPSSAESPAPGSAEDRERLLREEREMVNQARTALRGGDTGGAMRLLEQARVKFPSGALGQEREALAIETLAKSGAREAASTRAAAFIKAHPTSPHAARLQVFVTLEGR